MSCIVIPVEKFTYSKLFFNYDRWFYTMVDFVRAGKLVEIRVGNLFCDSSTAHQVGAI